MKAIQRNNNQQVNLNEELKFEALVDAIENRDVLLIVGRGFEVNTESEENKSLFNRLGESKDLYDIILDHLKSEYESDAIDFSELNEDSNFSYKEGNIWRHKNIYDAICETINAFDLTLNDVNPRLMSLIKTGYFRFVFTLSFSPLVEKAMQEQWGEENLRILNVLDKDISNRDIVDSNNDLLTPTVYYLFGKANEKNSFVVTDNDALGILQRWQSKMLGARILEATGRKHLLALGCTQDDWLFRFIWYTLKGNSNISKGSVGRYADSNNLERYLRRNNILEKKDADSFIDKILLALKERRSQRSFESPHEGCDVFISYSRRDGDVADAVFRSLSQQGLDVWYDKYNLAGKGGEYMKIIYHAIETCKLFVPILTPTISEQRTERHPYRLEWNCAVNELIMQKGVRCCVPVIDSAYDLYKKAYEDKIPDEIKNQDGYIFNRYSLEFEKWAVEIKNIIAK